MRFSAEAIRIMMNPPRFCHHPLPLVSIMSLFKIKICGITNADDLDVAVQAGADAIGLNFYAPSVRSVTAAQAASLANGLEATGRSKAVKLVGVFVNHSIDEIVATAKTASLNVIQLHGDERPDFVAPLQAKLAAIDAVLQPSVIRAVRVRKDLADRPGSADQAGALAREVDQGKAVGARLVLLDAAVPGSYGGTGHQLDWDAVGLMELSLPVALAGGLDADNVAQAIASAKPAAVDVASGVERTTSDAQTSPQIARKDHRLVRRFVGNAIAAFG